jgi:hypothetical protein
MGQGRDFLSDHLSRYNCHSPRSHLSLQSERHQQHSYNKRVRIGPNSKFQSQSQNRTLPEANDGPNETVKRTYILSGSTANIITSMITFTFSSFIMTLSLQVLDTSLSKTFTKAIYYSISHAPGSAFPADKLSMMIALLEVHFSSAF